MLAVLAVTCGTAAALSAAGAPPSHDPYTASLAYAKCVRQHGVPHPDPDSRGDFHLTPAQEQRLRSVPRKQRQAAETACFHYLKGLNLKPLSREARARALKVLLELKQCVRAAIGYDVWGKPVVRNLTRGRAFFGFEPTPAGRLRPSNRVADAMHTCEKQVDLAKKIDRIIAVDRAPGDL